MLFSALNARIEKLVIHKIGSRSENTENVYSKSCLPLDSYDGESPIPMLLKQYFVASFREPNLYHFEGRNADLATNLVYGSACAIFDNPNVFYEHSRILAQLLYENSLHPNIKPGEFYVSLFDDIEIFGETVKCIGLFKSENKETYLKVATNGESFEVNCEDGINIKKLDKGCLIFNVERESGFAVSLIDKISKQGEAVFWKDNFLGLTLRQDETFFTQNYIDLYKGFVNNVFSPAASEEVQRTDQIEMQNRSMDYFKGNTMFNEENFEQEVLGGNSDVIDAFKMYKQEYSENTGVDMDRTEFKISPDIVKKENKNFKSVLKLDKNFHIYVHGGQNLIERGFDQRVGMHYYKVFFETES